MMLKTIHLRLRNDGGGWTCSRWDWMRLMDAAGDWTKAVEAGECWGIGG